MGSSTILPTRFRSFAPEHSNLCIIAAVEKEPEETTCVVCTNHSVPTSMRARILAAPYRGAGEARKPRPVSCVPAWERSFPRNPRAGSFISDLSTGGKINLKEKTRENITLMSRIDPWGDKKSPPPPPPPLNHHSPRNYEKQHNGGAGDSRGGGTMDNGLEARCTRWREANGMAVSVRTRSPTGTH